MHCEYWVTVATVGDGAAISITRKTVHDNVCPTCGHNTGPTEVRTTTFRHKRFNRRQIRQRVFRETGRFLPIADSDFNHYSDCASYGPLE